MKTVKTTIQCPNCGTEINVNDVLSHQVEEKIRKEFYQKNQQMQADFEKREKAFESVKQQFEKEKKQQDALVNAQVEAAKKALEVQMTSSIKKKIEAEHAAQYKQQQEELNEKSEKLKEFNQLKATLAKTQREKNELKDKIQAETETKMNEILKEEKKKLQKLAEEKYELQLRKMDKQLEDQKKLTEEMKRKQEQGSMQLQGEVQELAIEEYLASNFPTDNMEEIKKGAHGADCIQFINTYERQNCGMIYYESKRTKNFQTAWIEKFKTDIRNSNADMGVLVTQQLPTGMERMGLYEGIYICTFEEFKGLAALLRHSMIQLSFAQSAQINKGEKMEMLYQYLTGNEFKLQVEGIKEGFEQMQTDLIKEKNAMKRLWKKREKQIDKVLINTVEMYGSLKGIAGNSLPHIESLELGYENED